MSSQEAKYHLSLAGEFYVAAELQRRGIGAAVTYGNAKKADVVAFTNGNLAVAIEVKSTRGPRWVVGSDLPPSSPAPWVFVHVPEKATDPPSFFILTQAKLHEIISPVEDAYYRKYLAKHKEEYGDRRGVVNLTAKQAEPFRNQWATIVDLLRKVGQDGSHSADTSLVGAPNQAEAQQERAQQAGAADRPQSAQ